MIYLIRHGETEFNARGVYQGRRVDSPLTDNGKGQAATIGLRLAPTLSCKEVVVIKSPMPRTWYTEEWVWRGANYHSTWNYVDQRIAELDYGRWEGLNAREIECLWPGTLEGRATQGPGYRMPDGESYNDLVERVTSFCRDLNPELDYVIVTHKRTSQAIREVLFPELPASEHTQDSYFILDLNGHSVTQHTVGV